jgi:hypothetical protein
LLELILKKILDSLLVRESNGLNNFGVFRLS